jgi:hypothetical protein
MEVMIHLPTQLRVSKNGKKNKPKRPVTRLSLEPGSYVTNVSLLCRYRGIRSLHVPETRVGLSANGDGV